MNCRMISNWRSCGNCQPGRYRLFPCLWCHKENNQLMVWYAWAQAMGGYGMPQGYEATEALNNVLAKIEALNFDEQISMFGQLLATWAIAT